MTRLPDLTPATLTEAQKAAVNEIVSGPHARVVGPYLAWLQSPELARRTRSLSEFIRFKSSVPHRLMEIGILVTGRHWKAEFEYFAHAKLARQAGVADDVIAAIAANQRPAFKQADEEAVYDLCTELFRSGRAGDKTFAAAEKALGKTAVVELIATIGYYSMVSITLNAYGVPLPPGEKSPFPD